MFSAYRPSPFTNNRHVWIWYWQKRLWGNKQVAGGSGGQKPPKRKK